MGAFSKGAKALGKVENIGDGVKGLGKSAGSKVKDFGKLSEPIDLMSKAKKNHSVINKSTATGDELLKYLNRIDKNLAEEFFKTGKWPDHIQVPKSSNVLTKTGAIDWAQVPNDGFVLDKAGNAIKESYVPSVGTKFDRYGAADGRFTSPLENGEKFLYDQRSLPYVEEINKYHKYEITGDFSNIEAKINNANPVLKKAVESYMEQWDLSYNQLNIQAREIAKGLAKLIEESRVQGFYYVTINDIFELSKGYDEISKVLKRSEETIIKVRLNDQNFLMVNNKEYKEENLKEDEAYYIVDGYALKIKQER
ncbi:hypothetical protein BFC22_10095 [Carnobacterium divergens]|uniref:glycohydrolase toxin TNT-related protein n=1 Tax=Carnobacterium divergens TaxID=2748 RepID=UPI000E722168|nr:glycohydrolase toxin TNT-related protein [Carnobacterium divergens]AOA00443.1 hypothetical protein BFC22_10095 [Carnobacterium divergens]